MRVASRGDANYQLEEMKGCGRRGLNRVPVR